MTAALHRARIKAAGHEAVCVSHQLPVETLRRAMNDKPLHHFPTRRMCNLASLTSFYFHGDSLRRLGLFGAGRAVRRWVVIASAALVVLAGCSTGDDAVAQGGTFEFVAPGGKTDIFYDPPESRGRPGPLAGPDLMDPAKTVSLDDFADKVVVINVWGQWCGPCRVGDRPAAEGVRRHQGRRRRLPRHRRARQQPRRRPRLRDRPQGHASRPSTTRRCAR